MAAEQRARRRSRIAAYLLGAITLGLALLVVFGLRWEEKEFDNGYGEEALRNRFLAAQRLLERHEIEAETASGLALLDELPDPDHMLVLSSARRALSDRRRRNLFEWIGAGGHLVVVAREPYHEGREASADPLLEGLGIFLIDPELEDDDEEEEDGEDEESHIDLDQEEEEGGDEEEGEAQTLEEWLTSEALQKQLEEMMGEVSEDGLPACVAREDLLAYAPRVGGAPDAQLGESDEEADDDLQIELFGVRHLESAEEPDLAFEGTHGMLLVSVPSGAGRLTAATSLEPWHNDRIHCHDHAYALWLLARASPKVWFLHDPDVPSLPQLVTASFPLAGVGAVALFLIWGASTSLRFGVQPRLREGERRELLEHLEAGAQFLWRRGLIASTLVQLRDDIDELCDRQHGFGEALSPRQRTEILSGLARLPEEEVASALYGPPPGRRRELVHTTRTLQAIRRTL